MSPRERSLPSDLDSEAAVLGAIMLDSTCISEVSDHITPADFYDQRNGELFRLMLAMDGAREPIDFVTVKSRLRDSGRLDAIGGLARLSALADEVPVSDNAESYARSVAERSTRRAVILAALEIGQKAHNPTDDVDAFIDWAEGRLFSARRRASARPYVGLSVAVREVVERIESIQAGESPLGLDTGLSDVDRLTGGFKAGELTILAARPSMGKTSLALSMARDMVMRGKRIGFFSLETGRTDLVTNVIAQLSSINSRRIRSGEIDRDNEAEFFDAAERISTHATGDLVVDDNSSQTISRLRSRTRRMVAREGVEAVFVDYLQLVAAEGRRDSRQEYVSEISRSLKSLARELAIPVVALAQLSRKVEERPDKRPKMADLRESGSLEQDADVVLLLYRPHYYQPDKVELDQDAHLIVAKNRNGPTGEALLRFEAAYTRFSNATAQQRMRLAKGGRR